MNSLDKKQKVIGSKKRVVNIASVIDNVYSIPLSKCLMCGGVTNPMKLCDLMYKHINSGGDFNCRDARTGESFLHVACNSIQFYTAPTTVFIFYMLAIKVDSDIQDHYGDTALHKVVLIPGAWRCIVALMRCNANPLIKNNMGFTPQELILHHKKDGWEENIYWLKKFFPGLLAAVTAETPNVGLVEKLLKSWCRTTKVLANNTSVCVKSCCAEFRGDLVRLFEKYTNTSEFALSLLSGKLHIFEEIMKSDQFCLVDVNTRDHSYQYHYEHYPMAPRPLLAALWETEQYEIVKKYLTAKPDMAVKYWFEADASNPPKPLFFHLVNPKLRPRNDAITTLMLESADLSIRNEKGQTILFEAIFNDASSAVIKAILQCGVNIAARDNTGMTARDHCMKLQRFDYKELIDDFVRQLVGDRDIATLESLVFQMYDGIPTITNPTNQCDSSSNEQRELQTQESSCLVDTFGRIQGTIKMLFTLIKRGDYSGFLQLMTSNFASARDKAGRSFLHYAVQHNKIDKLHVPNSNYNGCSFHTVVDGENNKSNDDDESVMNHDGSSNGINMHCCQSGEDVCVVPTDRGILGIINFLVENHSHLAPSKNNLGQTPLHYAHIYSADQEVFNILEKAGDYGNVEDVFDLKPNDYSQSLSGHQTFEDRRKPTIDMDLDIFLNETSFEKHLHRAIESGNLNEISPLIDPLLDFGGESCFNHVLFDCLDARRLDVATFLISKGFNPNISKQYDQCNPENPMCAMMECSHSVTTLRQRAEELELSDLVTLIDEGLKVYGCS